MFVRVLMTANDIEGSLLKTAADEQQLIRQVQVEGSRDAFRILVERYMRQAYNIAFGYVNDHDDAEDVAQESFVRVFRSIRSFRGDAEFSTWLYRIVSNLAMNHIRKQKRLASREQRTTDTVADYPGLHSELLDRLETKDSIERALHQLPTLQRATVILRHLNGLSTKQVSGILSCSEGTVKTHLYRGLKKLKSKLQDMREP